MNKKTYLIHINAFLYNSGGIVALHKLCHDLNSLGESSFILTPVTHKKLNAPFVNKKTISNKDTVVVYPEIVQGNPLNAKNVVRWILNTPGNCAGVKSFYDFLDSRDLFFMYSEYFTLKSPYKSSGLLTTTFVDTDYFYPSTQKREGSAFFIKKGGCKEPIHPRNSINLSNFEHDWQTMGDVLRKVEYFYCYDNACFWVVLAAICGCIPIVVPDSNMSADTWYSKFPHKRCGVAYGIGELDHAIKTQPFVQENLQKFYEEQLNTVKNFIKICEETFI